MSYPNYPAQGSNWAGYPPDGNEAASAYIRTDWPPEGYSPSPYPQPTYGRLNSIPSHSSFPSPPQPSHTHGPTFSREHAQHGFEKQEYSHSISSPPPPSSGQSSDSRSQQQYLSALNYAQQGYPVSDAQTSRHPSTRQLGAQSRTGSHHSRGPGRYAPSDGVFTMSGVGSDWSATSTDSGPETSANPYKHAGVESGACYVCEKDGCFQVVPKSEKKNHNDHHADIMKDNARRERRRRERKEREKAQKQEEGNRHNKREGEDRHNYDGSGAGTSSYFNSLARPSPF